MTQISLTGLRVVPGHCDAPVFVLSASRDIWEVPIGCCLVLRSARPDVVVAFDRARAIVCETGGATSHLAILAREVGIPCFVGVTGVLKACADLDKAICHFDVAGDTVFLRSEQPA